MKILYLTHTVSWKGGGIFFTAFHQGRHLVRKGHEVTLLSISPSSKMKFTEKIVEGLKFVETPDLLIGAARTGWDVWDTIRRNQYLRNTKFDIIHGFESRPVVSIPAFKLAKATNTPVVLTWADWFGKGGRSEERAWPINKFMPPVEEYFEKTYYPKADHLIVMGQPLYKKALKAGISKEKISILLHGSDAEQIKTYSKDKARRNLGNRLPEDTHIISYLGYLWAVNAKLLFESFHQIKEKLRKPVKLLLIGNHRINIDVYIPPELSADIIETGWISYQEINDFLCASDILLLPLKSTPVSENIWPSKLNDYLAAGRPIVATDMKVLDHIYRQVPFGLLVEDSPESIADGVIKILSDDDMSIRFSNNARIAAEQLLAWPRIVDNLESIYCKLNCN